MTLPKPLQVVTLYHLQGDAEGGEVLYRVRVQEIQPDTLVLDSPLGPKADPVFLSPGAKVLVGYSIADRALYLFESVVQGQGGEGLQQLFVSRPRPEEIRKLQRRNFFRVPVQVDVVIQGEDGSNTVVAVSDLSGGGFSFKRRAPLLTVGQEAAGMIRLARGIELEFTAHVRRVEFLAQPNLYLHGLQFTRILDAHRKRIVQYCLERQRKLLRISRS
ncbi:flagellar brake protein [Tumebacillus flagellatus]|uniref:PilZ domain-containing protein n=1 Tax=Tumebacillus flagellatus TaxID=1157490 RepID=A0A074LNX7_9BACL|nr:PilZ domain-containing protein [Tumebacillus flagellatus]KEO82190.1 hypothetical protein EL26_16775 [Tumebacillus flagellatus]